MTRSVFLRFCWVPAAVWAATWLYLRSYDGWGAWASAPLLLPSLLLSGLWVIIGLILLGPTKHATALALVLSPMFAAACSFVSAAEIPHLQRQGTATRLIVEDKPFLVLGGELGNSTASSLEYLKPHRKTLKEMHLNTVLAPVSWELIEPVEGRFDFSLVDGLLRDAREAELRLVLLWFGSYKNSMSTYVPGWVKRQQDRFPRAESANGESQEILSAFSANNREADATAFKALLAHLRDVDARQNTVIMVQVENETGMLPTAREYGAEANRQFAAPVAPELLSSLAANRAELVPELRMLWEANGAKTDGDWRAVFGSGNAAEEIFTACVPDALKAVRTLTTFCSSSRPLSSRTRARGEWPA
ncbi:MAG: beta-galactosidase [Woeseia sp.]